MSAVAGVVPAGEVGRVVVVVVAVEVVDDTFAPAPLGDRFAAPVTGVRQVAMSGDEDRAVRLGAGHPINLVHPPALRGRRRRQAGKGVVRAYG